MILRIRNNNDKRAIAGYILKLPDGKAYDVTISLKRAKRSLNQNRMYWMWLNCISDDTGGHKDQIHTELKAMFMPKKEVSTIDGELIKVPKSTTELNTKEFTDYLTQVQVFAASELGIILPVPEDEVWNIFVEQFDR